jgi:4-amino-4-deoxy-L-arabinose transferase-like glycosyltransferase
MPGFGGTPGFTRFGEAGIAGLITWLFPLALLGAGVASTRSRFSWPIGREHLGLVLWGGWFVTHWVVFSFAQGIFHEYYTTVMGPAVAALAGIGVVALWDASRQGGWKVGLLPSTILLTAAWQASIVNHYPDWRRWLLPTILGAAVLGSLGLIASRWLALRWSSIPWARISASVGMTGLLVCPMLWSLAPVLTQGFSLLPAADPTMLGVKRDGTTGLPFPPGFGASDPKQTRKLIDFLTANRHEAKILVAGLDSMSMAPIIIETGEPAVSIGGFMGGDPALTKAQFVAMVEDGRLRFFYFGGGPGGGGPPGGPGGPPGGGPGFSLPPVGLPRGRGFPDGGPPGMMRNSEITAWVREHGKAVDARLWKVQDPAEEAEPEPSPDEPFDPARMFRRMKKMTQLYDLRPELGLVETSAR